MVWTTERAYEHGFLENPSSWANLGQGAPEVDDDIVGSFARPTTLHIGVNSREYGQTQVFEIQQTPSLTQLIIRTHRWY